MTILLINLGRGVDRLRFQVEQFSQLNLKFSRIPAIDGSSLDADFYRSVRVTGARVMTPDEVACTLSHARCWQYAVDKQQPVVVLEDDAVLDPSFGLVTDILLNKAVSENLFINLECFIRKKIVGKHLTTIDNGRFSLDELVKSGGGAAGYIITPSIAKKFLELSKRRLYIADTFINLFYDVQYAQVSPALVMQLMFSTPSANSLLAGKATTIADRKKVPTNSLSSVLLNPMTRYRRLASNVVGWRRRIAALSHSRRISVAPRNEMHHSLRAIECGLKTTTSTLTKPA